MTNRGKRISELTALTSASLDTTIVGVDNGTTYKIELDTLADAVTSRVNTLDRSRLDSIESITSSFETKGRGILSGSVSYTSLTNIPQGIVSQSTDLSSLNQFTASISTASLVTSINNLNQFTSSYYTDSASFKSEITTEKNRIDAILSASNANSDTFAEVVSLINSVDLTNDNAFATFYTASNNRITSLENSTGSYLTSLNGAISSSSQLTSSYDTRYVISGSITQTTWDNIASKPVGIVSSSIQVLGGSGVVSGSYETTGRGIVSGSSQLTSSFDTRYALSASFVSSSNLSSIRTITSASYAALTPVSGTLYIIIG